MTQQIDRETASMRQPNRAAWALCALVGGGLLVTTAVFGLRLRPYWVARHRGRGADLRGVMLIRASLAGADLMAANLREANLDCADLSRAELAGANLQRAHLAGAKLCQTELRDT